MEAEFSVTAASALKADVAMEPGAEKLAPVASSEPPEQPASAKAVSAAQSTDTTRGALCFLQTLTVDEYRREALKKQVKARVYGLPHGREVISGQTGGN